MYSIKWLLERSGKDAVKDCIFDLPDSLNKKFLSPSSQTRSYPFTTILQTPLHGKEREVDQNNSGDVSFIGSQKQVKMEKDYTISPQNQQRTFQRQEDTRDQNYRSNVFPRSNNETPAHHGNLFPPTATKQSSAGLMAAVAEAMNVQSRPAPQQLDPKIKALRKGEYLHSRMEPNKSLPTSPSDRLQHPETSTPGVVRQRNKVPHDYDFKHENAKKASHACSGVPHEMNLKSLADTYPENPPPSREQPNSRRRRRTSSLKESERALVATMLMEKLRKYSVQPSKLSYASRTASKHIKNELKGLGYVEVPVPNLDDAHLTIEEKIVLSFQREIKKYYHSAIYKASKELSELSRYQKHFSIQPRKKNLRYNDGQFY